MNKTVFISSTFDDLEKHRKKVWEVLRKYDVNLRGMEQFGARTEKPLITCITEVEQSDVYVGIIACRLGSIDASSGKSYTQLEYERAHELNKEILIYFIDDKNGEISPSSIDFGINHEKLESFKSVLKDRHTIDTFKNEADLAEKLERKFKELLSLKKDEKPEYEDDFAKAYDLITRFMLIPKTYTGKNIKLRIKNTSEPFSASKAICNCFGFEFGKTIGVEIKIDKPDVASGFEYLFIDDKIIDAFLLIGKSKEYDIYAKMLFSQTSIDDCKTKFYHTYRSEYIENPNYNPYALNLPAFGGMASGIASIYSGSNQKYIENRVRVPGDGTIILSLKEIVTSG